MTICPLTDKVRVTYELKHEPCPCCDCPATARWNYNENYDSCFIEKWARNTRCLQHRG